MGAYGNPQCGPVSDAFGEWFTKAVESSLQERHRLLANWELGTGTRRPEVPPATR